MAFEDDSVEEWMDRNERILGPTVMAKQALEPAGRWGPLRAELTALYSAANQASDGKMRVEAEYLLSVVTLPS